MPADDEFAPPPIDNPELMKIVAEFRKEAKYPPAAILGLWVHAPKGMPHVVEKPGSVQRECEGCNSLVWIGPQQLKVVDGPLETVIVCPACAYSLGLMGEDAVFTPLSDKSHDLVPPFD